MRMKLSARTSRFIAARNRLTVAKYRANPGDPFM
jgi:hypothetical protein